MLQNALSFQPQYMFFSVTFYIESKPGNSSHVVDQKRRFVNIIHFRKLSPDIPKKKMDACNNAIL